MTNSTPPAAPHHGQAPTASAAAGRPGPAGATTSLGVDISLIGVFAALIAVLALIPPIPVGSVGVPITLQTLGVALCGLVLGPWRGFLAAALYVLVGLLGLPVFSGGAGGPGVLAGGSAGYLLAFPLSALLAGFLTKLWLGRSAGFVRYLLLLAAGLIASFVFVHPLGILGIMVNVGIPLEAAFAADIVFWPGDVIKNLLAAGIALTVHRAFPQILLHRSLPGARA